MMRRSFWGFPRDSIATEGEPSLCLPGLLTLILFWHPELDIVRHHEYISHSQHIVFRYRLPLQLEVFA
jgi:hypothetical protein